MIHFKIVTPEKVVYEDEVAQCTIPTTEGEITVLPHHIPLISILNAGELRFLDKEGEHVMAVWGGFVQVQVDSQLTILADNVERAEDIDIARADEARKRAEELMKKRDEMEDVDFARIQATMEKELNRIRVGEKWKKFKKPQGA